MAVPVGANQCGTAAMQAAQMERTKIYQSLTTKLKEALFKLSRDGADRKEVLEDIDKTLGCLKTNFSAELGSYQPLDVFLINIFEEGEDKNAAYRAYILTNLMENQKIQSQNAPLFRAVSYLIYGNTKEADKLIITHDLRYQAEQHPNPSGNATLQNNLSRVLDRVVQKRAEEKKER